MKKSENINKLKRIIFVFLIVVMMIYTFQWEISADESELVEQSNTETELEQEDLETANEQIESDNTDVNTLQNYISGVLWLDVNDDGIRDVDETGIENYPVYLYTAGNMNDPVANTVTNQNGLYTLTDIPPGEYVVGLKSNENDTDYLFPTVGIDNDNKFEIDNESNTRAFTKVITIERKTIAKNYDGGMREMSYAITRAVRQGYVVTKGNDNAYVGTKDTLKDAVRLCEKGSIAYTITLTGNDMYMTGNAAVTSVNVSVTIPKNCTITLTSDNRAAITQKQRSRATASSRLDEIQNARHLNVEGTLILDNIILEGAGYNGEYPYGYTGGVYVNGGSLTMRNNASITNCYNREGGAVYVNGETGTSKFVMDGGTIFANKAISIQNKKSAAFGHGGGVYAYGSNASFEMSGGTINQNEILRANTGFVIGYGGGVAATDGAIFDMNGNALIDNNTAGYGAGVYIAEQSNFNMLGNAKIINNTAQYERYGGGVCVRYESTFNMHGNAVIENNTAKYGGGTYLQTSIMNMYENALVIENQTSSDGAGGGGVCLTYDKNILSELNMSGNSKIINNKTNRYGGGVFSGGKIVMSDNAEIGGNVADNKKNDGDGGNGGGICINQSSATVTLYNKSKITNNKASGLGGGVYAFQGTVFMNDTVTINENISEFVGEGGGGGIYLNRTGYLNMTGGKIEDNHADAAMGGGVYTVNYQYKDPVDNFKTYYTNITIKDKKGKIFSPFSGNTASAKYNGPSNADKSTQFNGKDLTNYSINYKSIKVYFPLKFYKADIQSAPDIKYLEGANFNLYKWTGSEKPSATVDVNIPGDWEPIATLTSDETGFVQYDQLETGKYYQLVEIKAPYGYSVPDGQWQIYIETAYTTVFPYDCYKVIGNAPVFEKISNKDEYILTNEKDQGYDFNFTKVDAADNSILIAGVEFSLYEWTAKSPVSGLADVNHPGNNWALVRSVESDSTGKVSFAGLPKGSYQLVETQAHSGYNLPIGQWQIIVNADGTFTITAVPGTDNSVPPAFKASSGSYMLGNYVNSDLPAMGGGGTLLFTLIGSLLVMTGMIYAFIHLCRMRRKV